MFLNRQNVIQLKGCVACEIHSHEVLLTELLFTNIFGHFEPPEIAALLSCVIFQQVFGYIVGGRYLLLSCFNKGWFLQFQKPYSIHPVPDTVCFLCRTNAANQILQRSFRRYISVNLQYRRLGLQYVAKANNALDAAFHVPHHENDPHSTTRRGTVQCNIS